MYTIKKRPKDEYIRSITNLYYPPTPSIVATNTNYSPMNNKEDEYIPDGREGR